MNIHIQQYTIHHDRLHHCMNQETGKTRELVRERMTAHDAANITRVKYSSIPYIDACFMTNRHVSYIDSSHLTALSLDDCLMNLYKSSQGHVTWASIGIGFCVWKHKVNV